jgi:hypothetical protein
VRRAGAQSSRISRDQRFSGRDVGAGGDLCFSADCGILGAKSNSQTCFLRSEIANYNARTPAGSISRILTLNNLMNPELLIHKELKLGIHTSFIIKNLI